MRPVVIFVTPPGTKCPKMHGSKALARGENDFGTGSALWWAKAAEEPEEERTKKQEDRK
jgi:hypothetical protein